MIAALSAFNSIRGRMWAALALLALATMLVGGVAWFTLDKADSDLNNLHRQTLSEVAKALSLSKRSTDLATTAPYLLNLTSTYRINQEGRTLAANLEDVRMDWAQSIKQAPTIPHSQTKIMLSLDAMKSAILDLVTSSEKLDTFLQRVNVTNTQLGVLRNVFSTKMRLFETTQESRLNWLALQSMANHALGAGFAGNLLGVGEYHRNLVEQQRAIESVNLTQEQQQYLEQITLLSFGVDGIFELRRRELSFNLAAQNALFHIRYNAGLISDLAGALASNAEVFLSEKRSETSSSIAFAKTLIVFVGVASVAVALTSALYVSGYVTKNISLVSNAMKRLASGDRKSELHRQVLKRDEIGDLFRSFRVFRANALRLDRSNDQLNRRNALFEKVFNNISDGVAITDEDGKLNAYNPNFETLILAATKSNELANISQILESSKFNDAAREQKLSAQFWGFVELQAEDGQIVEVRVTRLPDEGRVWLFSDATERKKMDERISEIRRIESLGKVTGEVAHDFGNILSTISSNLYLMENKSAMNAKQIRERISNAVEIGTSLTQRLLAFARKQQLTPELTEINSLVEGLTDLISVGLKRDVVLKTSLPDEPIHLRVDPGQLESAILNLCLNSNQAIERKGEITITVRSAPPQVVILEVHDNGGGMDNVTRLHAKEPFFTKRHDGDGTGLGLSMVYGFIKQTGGDMQIESEEGIGTTVRLVLPTNADLSEIELKRTDKRALVVEDDPIALVHSANILKKLGYSVETSNTFENGMNKLKSNHDFDLILTDLQLDNGGSGWDITERALDISNDTQIIVVSGRLPETHAFLEQHQHRVSGIPKPIAAGDVEATLSKLNTDQNQSRH